MKADPRHVTLGNGSASTAFRRAADRRIPAIVLLGVVVVVVAILVFWVVGPKWELHECRESGRLVLPRRFVMAEPECADRLLAAWGIANVRVVRVNESLERRR